MKRNSSRRKHYETASEEIKIRITPKMKKNIKLGAAHVGISMTAFMLKNAFEDKIVSNRLDNESFAALLNITREMNMIGNNINQVTVAIHQIKLERRIATDEYNQLQRLIKLYMDSRGQLRDLLLSVQFLKEL